jgi:hypothetical protein
MFYLLLCLNSRLVSGLCKLANDEVAALVHYGSDRQEQRTLIRIKNPESEQ